MAEATETRGDAIENLMREDRTFAPPAAFVERANFPDEAVYA
ncbi:MAG: hypothetical protein JWM98_2029, partial [Thermoleophilia bacterium]|nr:hypothetical protein [Thermoleophilia bacterium]